MFDDVIEACKEVSENDKKLFVCFIVLFLFLFSVCMKKCVFRNAFCFNKIKSPSNRSNTLSFSWSQ